MRGATSTGGIFPVSWQLKERPPQATLHNATQRCTTVEHGQSHRVQSHNRPEELLAELDLADRRLDLRQDRRKRLDQVKHADWVGAGKRGGAKERSVNDQQADCPKTKKKRKGFFGAISRRRDSPSTRGWRQRVRPYSKPFHPSPQSREMRQGDAGENKWEGEAKSLPRIGGTACLPFPTFNNHGQPK